MIHDTIQNITIYDTFYDSTTMVMLIMLIIIIIIVLYSTARLLTPKL
jgi:hypothetical protein